MPMAGGSVDRSLGPEQWERERERERVVLWEWWNVWWFIYWDELGFCFRDCKVGLLARLLGLTRYGKRQRLYRTISRCNSFWRKHPWWWTCNLLLYWSKVLSRIVNVDGPETGFLYWALWTQGQKIAVKWIKRLQFDWRKIRLSKNDLQKKYTENSKNRQNIF